MKPHSILILIASAIFLAGCCEPAAKAEPRMDLKYEEAAGGWGVLNRSYLTGGKFVQSGSNLKGTVSYRVLIGNYDGKTRSSSAEVMIVPRFETGSRILEFSPLRATLHVDPQTGEVAIDQVFCEADAKREIDPGHSGLMFFYTHNGLQLQAKHLIFNGGIYSLRPAEQHFRLEVRYQEPTPEEGQSFRIRHSVRAVSAPLELRAGTGVEDSIELDVRQTGPQDH